MDDLRVSWTAETAIKQIECCGFECETGPIENALAWRWLKEHVKQLREENSRLREGWQDIATAPEDGYIVVAWQDGTRWRFAQVFNEHGEWVDVHSDRIHHPTHWMPLPAPPSQGNVTGEDRV